MKRGTFCVLLAAPLVSDGSTSGVEQEKYFRALLQTARVAQGNIEPPFVKHACIRSAVLAVVYLIDLTKMYASVEYSVLHCTCSSHLVLS